MSLQGLREEVMLLRGEATDEASQEFLDIVEGIIAEIEGLKEDIDEIIEVLEELIEETLENGESVEVRIR